MQRILILAADCHAFGTQTNINIKIAGSICCVNENTYSFSWPQISQKVLWLSAFMERNSTFYLEGSEN